MQKIEETIKKLLAGDKGRRVLLLLGAVGVLLLSVPALLPDKGGAEKPAPSEEASGAVSYRQELEASLSKLVTAITGESDPTVMVTLEDGGRSVFAQDEQSGEHERESAHVLLKSSDGGQAALTVTQLKPEIKGVVIVSDLAADAAIREKLTEAVRTALHLSSNRVCVVDGN